MDHDKPLPQTPSVLLVESDRQVAACARRALSAHFPADRLTHLTSGRATRRLDLDTVDLAMCALVLPDVRITELVRELLSRRADLPVVVLADEAGIDRALAAMHEGACDYVLKSPDFARTLPRVVQKNLIRRAVRRQEARRQRELARTLEQFQQKSRQLETTVAQLEAMAGTDPLTGLANRRSFARAMERCFADAQRHHRPLTCVMIDLDGFKQLNDTLGHPAGDRMLQRAARVFEANCRASDVAARFGGDEFIVLLPMTDEPTACQIAARIGRQFAHLAAVELDKAQAVPRRLSMSMGLACQTAARAANADQLVACADHALYRAKQTGKTRMVVYHPPQRPQHFMAVQRTVHLGLPDRLMPASPPRFP